MISKTNDKPRVAVIGAGVCGLGIGWRLAEAGCPVDLFDAGAAGHGATWAAGGMLAAGMEAEPGEEALLPLTLEAQRQWPAFRDALEAASGIDLGYRDEGTMSVATNRDEAARLRFNFDYQTGLGIEMEWLTGAEARAREPYLRAGIVGAAFREADHQVENRALAAALVAACRGAGARLHEHTPVEAVVTEAGRAAGVVAGGREHAADVVLLAAGAWSRRIAGVPDEALPPVRPLKGQMLALGMDPREPLIRHVVWGPSVYLIPRNDGRLLVGATVEERGFDDRMTAGGVYALIEAAWRLVPGIEELPIVETWAGFRPGCRDDAPVLGWTALPGLAVATGHHRNGILLAPITADAVAELILTGTGPEAIRAFAPDRFARRAA